MEAASTVANASAVVKRDYYHALYEVARTVNSTLSLPVVLNLIVESTAKAMNAKGCALRLLSPDREYLELGAVYGLSAAYLAKGPVQVSKTQVAVEALKGKPVVVLDAGDDPRLQYPEEAVRREAKEESQTICESTSKSAKDNFETHLENETSQNSTLTQNMSAYFDEQLKIDAKSNESGLHDKLTSPVDWGVTSNTNFGGDIAVGSTINNSARALNNATKNHATEQSSKRDTTIASTTTTEVERTQESGQFRTFENKNISKAMLIVMTQIMEIFNIYQSVDDIRLVFVNGMNIQTYRISETPKMFNELFRSSMLKRFNIIMEQLEKSLTIYDFKGRMIPLAIRKEEWLKRRLAKAMEWAEFQTKQTDAATTPQLERPPNPMLSGQQSAQPKPNLNKNAFNGMQSGQQSPQSKWPIKYKTPPSATSIPQKTIRPKPNSYELWKKTIKANQEVPIQQIEPLPEISGSEAEINAVTTMPGDNRHRLPPNFALPKSVVKPLAPVSPSITPPMSTATPPLGLTGSASPASIQDGSTPQMSTSTPQLAQPTNQMVVAPEGEPICLMPIFQNYYDLIPTEMIDADDMARRKDFEAIPGVVVNHDTISQLGNGFLPFFMLLSPTLLEEVKMKEATEQVALITQTRLEREQEVEVKKEILEFINQIGEELKDNTVVQQKIEAFYKLLKPDTKLLNQAFLGHVTKNAEDPRGFHLQ